MGSQREDCSVLECDLRAHSCQCAMVIGNAGPGGEWGNAFYPAAVWYSGGKARAPMLERIDATSATRWGADLDQIKADGFDTVKTWIDWQTGEPRRGEFNFDNLNLLMRLAQERGLRVIIQIYLDSAPGWIVTSIPMADLSIAAALSSTRNRRQVTPSTIPASEARPLRSSEHFRRMPIAFQPLRLGCLERAPHRQLGRVSLSQ